MSTGFRKDRSSFYNGRKKLWRSSANLAGREKSDDSIQEFVFAIERILEFSIIYFFSIIDFILSLYLRIRLIFSSSNSKSGKLNLDNAKSRDTRAHIQHTRAYVSSLIKIIVFLEREGIIFTTSYIPIIETPRYRS